DAALLPESAEEGLAEDDAGVLDGVVVVDPGVALRLDDEVESTVLREKGQHVVEERHSGVDRGRAGAVDDEIEPDVGLGGFAMEAVFSGFRHGNRRGLGMTSRRETSTFPPARSSTD